MAERVFDELLGEAVRLLHEAEDCWQVWWFYVGEETPSHLSPAFSLFPWVRDTGVFAHFVATIIALGKLYDDSSDSLSFSRVMQEARTQNAVDAEILRLVRSDRKRAGQIWDRIKIIRNKNIAHFSAAAQIAEVFKKAGLKYKDVDEIIALSRSMLNRLCRARGKAQWVPDYAVRRELRRLWETILTARADEVEEYKSFIESSEAEEEPPWGA